MHDMAMTALAAGGRGGGKIAILVLLIVVVVLIVGWAMYAARARGRAGKQ